MEFQPGPHIFLQTGFSKTIKMSNLLLWRQLRNNTALTPNIACTENALRTGSASGSGSQAHTCKARKDRHLKFKVSQDYTVSSCQPGLQKKRPKNQKTKNYGLFVCLNSFLASQCYIIRLSSETKISLTRHQKRFQTLWIFVLRSWFPTQQKSTRSNGWTSQ